MTAAKTNRHDSSAGGVYSVTDEAYSSDCISDIAILVLTLAAILTDPSVVQIGNSLVEKIQAGATGCS